MCLRFKIGSHCQVSILHFFKKFQNQYTLVPTQSFFYTISPNPFFFMSQKFRIRVAEQNFTFSLAARMWA